MSKVSISQWLSVLREPWTFKGEYTLEVGAGTSHELTDAFEKQYIFINVTVDITVTNVSFLLRL